eukprot:GHVR01109196.1.p1 GENE.GHVR01109196.1~~GHVR01109196.1.p1  ORF type:complete len:275 (-),score=70.52 GHVR01109196.1:609-1433(-)
MKDGKRNRSGSVVESSVKVQRAIDSFYKNKKETVATETSTKLDSSVPNFSHPEKHEKQHDEKITHTHDSSTEPLNPPSDPHSNPHSNPLKADPTPPHVIVATPPIVGSVCDTTHGSHTLKQSFGEIYWENIITDIGWREALASEICKDYFVNCVKRVAEAREAKPSKIFPPAHQVFAAFNFTPLSDVKVVIVGQDPYHGKGQAMGLSFSVNDGVRIPPSLKNIYTEANVVSNSGDLNKWATQGVLMLNALYIHIYIYIYIYIYILTDVYIYTTA